MSRCSIIEIFIKVVEVLKIIDEEASMTVVIFSSLLTRKQLPAKWMILLYLMKKLWPKTRVSQSKRKFTRSLS